MSLKPNSIKSGVGPQVFLIVRYIIIRELIVTIHIRNTPEVTLYKSPAQHFFF